MKKTLITLMALSSVAMAEILTFSSDATNTSGQNNTGYVVTDGKAELTSGNIKIKWTETNESLTSWTMSFDLLDSALISKSPDSSSSSAYSGSVSVLFGTEISGGGAGFLLAITNTGALTLFTHKSDTTFETWTTADGWISAGEKTSIVMSYIANEADEYYGFYNKGEAAGTIVGGTFTLTSGDKTASFDITHDMSHATLVNNNGSLWTNGGAEKLYNISVGSLANNIIPEPATATLSLLALAGLAARRRRK